MAKKQKDVTLIELLVVVVLLATLAVIAVPQISHSAAIAKANTCKTNINMLNCAIGKYYLVNGLYPANLGVIKLDTSLFPDDQPICPVTKGGYPNRLTSSKRVDASKHNH